MTTIRYTGVRPRDVDAAHALLDRLADRGQPVDTLIVTRGGLVAELDPSATPADGLRVLREIADTPADPIRVDRRARYADLAARVLGRRTRLRVHRPAA